MELNLNILQLFFFSEYNLFMHKGQDQVNIVEVYFS